MTYLELRAAFREWERNCPEQHLTAHIIFTVGSFDREYPLIARTYAVSSYNKAFRSGMGGYSIFGNSLDGTACYYFGDTTVRVEETVEDGYLLLTPISGDQVGPDGWTDLEMDRVYGYCSLLERQLNREWSCPKYERL